MRIQTSRPRTLRQLGRPPDRGVATFLLDQHVPSDVARMLRRRRHRAHTAYEAGLADAEDDDLTVAGDVRGWVVVTCDKEFGTAAQPGRYRAARLATMPRLGD
jgi:hypothetical protein